MLILKVDNYSEPAKKPDGNSEMNRFFIVSHILEEKINFSFCVKGALELIEKSFFLFVDKWGANMLRWWIPIEIIISSPSNCIHQKIEYKVKVKLLFFFMCPVCIGWQKKELITVGKICVAFHSIFHSCHTNELTHKCMNTE